jgi:hypothetical protein
MSEGIKGCGVVYELSPNSDGTWTESVLHTFGDDPASRPNSPLLLDPSGNLYGVTVDGTGNAPFGTIFKMAPNAGGNWTYSLVHVFRDEPVAYPSGPLIEMNGNLYGPVLECRDLETCEGAVFELAP